MGAELSRDEQVKFSRAVRNAKEGPLALLPLPPASKQTELFFEAWAKEHAECQFTFTRDQRYKCERARFEAMMRTYNLFTDHSEK